MASTVGMAGLFALVGGALNEVVGRRPVIILSSFLFLLGAIVMACAQHKETLLIGRLIIGELKLSLVLTFSF